MTASVAAAVASPRCSGARECAPRRRAAATEAARIGRWLVIGDGLYAEGRCGSSDAYTPPRMSFELPPDPSDRAPDPHRRSGSASVSRAARRARRLLRLRRLRGLAPADRRAHRLDRLPHAGRLRLDVRGHQLPDRDRRGARRPRPIPTDCAAQGAPAGDALTGRGRHAAGRLVRARRDPATGPTGPTVVLVARLGQQQERHARPRRDPPRRLQPRCSSTSATTGRARPRRPPRACARPSDVRGGHRLAGGDEGTGADRALRRLDGRGDRASTRPTATSGSTR